jgi:hypothetical protein
MNAKLIIDYMANFVVIHDTRGICDERWSGVAPLLGVGMRTFFSHPHVASYLASLPHELMITRYSTSNSKYCIRLFGLLLCGRLRHVS